MNARQKKTLRALFEITTAADVVRAGLRSLYVYREAVSVAESVCAGVPGVTICSDAARYFTAGGFTVTAAGVGYRITAAREKRP